MILIRREVWESADVVADESGSVGELGARELHAIAGIPGKTDGHGLQLSAGHRVERGHVKVDGGMGITGKIAIDRGVTPHLCMMFSD